MDPVGFYASEVHYCDHLAPIWHALDPDERAWFAVGSPAALTRAAEHGIEADLDRKVKRRQIGHIVVAAFNDLRAIGRTRAVYVEHGAGQTYDDGEAGHPHYSGGRNRHSVDLFIGPNPTVANANARAYPGTIAVGIGSPRLDRFAAVEPPRPNSGRPVVAVSFHFDTKLAVPEARWAYPFFSESVAMLQTQTRWKVLGHGHPRALGMLRPFYDQNEIEVVEQFDEVCERANVYVCDNSSTIYEFAALDRPVVLMNAPWYRKSARHGLRFWEFADVGYQVDDPWLLAETVRYAWEDPPNRKTRRREVSRLLFGPIDGRAAGRAAEAMRSVLP